MQSLILRQGLQGRCLLLLWMALPVWATLEEGAILLNWKKNLTHSGGKLANWGAGSSDPCGSNPWIHVSCDNSKYVQRVDLGSSELSGPLLPELGQLSKLTSLSLHNNSFSGSIPQELGNLTALMFLDLSRNQLSGPIPDSLKKLADLDYLNLNNNSLSGSFPVPLTKLPKLSEINLDSNNISGVVNVSRILDIIEATTTLNGGQSLGVVSVMNNSITHVVYQPNDLLNYRTVFKLQGNPYCAGSMKLYDDGRRCFCLQTCLITSLQEGTILFNWKNKLSNGEKLTNWAGSSDPCGSNPWFHVLCNPSGHVQRIDLGSSNISGPLGPELGQLPDLETLTLYNNSLNGRIPQEMWNLTALTFLDLSGNQLSGSIPDSLDNLTSLTYLKLSNNSLSGSFPESLTRLRRLTGIQLDSNFISGVLNYTRIRNAIDATVPINERWVGRSLILTNNNISDVVHQQDDFGNAPFIFQLQGNPYCAGLTELYDDVRRCFCQGKCAVITYAKKSLRLVIILVSSSCAILLVLAISFGLMFKRHAKRKLRKLEVEYRHKFAEFEVNPQTFLYSEIRHATQDFNESTTLGQGSFGTVYKGMLSNGNEVAIKKLKPMIAAQGEVDDFLNEVVFITKMKHRNLVNLKGYCMRGKERMLVYEYIENMDVEQSLLMGRNKEAMNWPVRFNICLGVAQGLHYLHTFAQPRVIHRDIKACNILLNTNYVPKIADFGLALLFPDEKTHISTATVAGTRGYLAPEYVSYGQLSEKADVYSFGVLCLEIVSGRKNIDQSKPANQVYLPNWALTLYEEGKLKDLIDPSLHLHVDEEMQALRVIHTSLSCLQQISERRPSMSDVQTTLQGHMELYEVFPMNVMVDSSILEDSSLLEESALFSPSNVGGVSSSREI